MEEDEIYCDECNEVMKEGYMIHDGIYHYCSDECLHKNISKEDYKKIYDMGFGFWTIFED